MNVCQMIIDMNYGLKNSDLDYIVNILKSIPAIEQAVIFGSRAVNKNRNGSDIDLALYGNNLDINILAHIHYLFEEESPLPFFFDLIDYTHLKKGLFKNKINQEGIVLYKKSKTPYGPRLSRT